MKNQPTLAGRDLSPANPIKRFGAFFVALLLLSHLSATLRADQIVPDGKYWVLTSGIYYVKSSMNNLLVADNTSQGPEIDGTWWRRSGEDIIMEQVPAIGFVTGSYWQNGGYYAGYKVWTDGASGVTHGKFYAMRWNSTMAYQTIWYGAATVNLQAANGQYVQCEGGGNQWVGANHSGAWTWEELTLTQSGAPGYIQSGQEFVFASRDYNKLLTAENGGGGAVNANRDNAGSWERFIMIKLTPGDQYVRTGDAVAIRTANGSYWSAVNGGGGLVLANQTNAGSWETFTITFTTPISR